MPAQGRRVAVGQSAKTLLQLRQQTLQAKVRDLRGRQFQGQRNAVQAPADIDHQRQLGVGQLKAVVVGHGPLDKQLQCGKTQRLGMVQHGNGRRAVQ
ncbi:hypothetical protein D3C76_1556410 [compost metagenome]